VQIGGSARGYPRGVVLVAWQPRLRAHRMVSRPEYLYIAAMRAVVRFCRGQRVGSEGGVRLAARSVARAGIQLPTVGDCGTTVQIAGGRTQGSSR
jgi:hypothetical protein